MKYAIKLKDGTYVQNMAWFSDMLPVVMLKTPVFEDAILLNSNDKEDIFQKQYKGSEFIPVYYKTQKFGV
ncbi:hypothetical protein ABE073_04610 [Lederbergia citrisecunda]|uniref:hypothetical protein n=1 Tax=Lederbergia citrisecunda TaxID=2833583 RepID=UPI003D27BFF0